MKIICMHTEVFYHLSVLEWVLSQLLQVCGL
uniref:Uncharacterized protein n=1 Tax=Anguilla anguilla TaxID=7936 RepID=A0A0E9R5E9_ANGAN